MFRRKPYGMSELDDLRARVAKRRRDVTNKVGRIRRSTGADVSGLSDDPRRDVSVVKKYNSKQLKSYLAKLDAFQSRSVGFVAGAGGVPIPKVKWQQYKNLEKQYNKIGENHEAKIADIFLPTAGMTLRQRNAMIHPTAAGEVVNRPYSLVERDATQVPGRDQLEKLIIDLRRKTSKKFLPAAIKDARGQLNKMISMSGMDLKVNLSDSQFDTLWNYTNFATLVSLSYEMQKLRAAGAKERWHDSVVEDASDDIGELLNWASGLDEPAANTGNKRGGKKKQSPNARKPRR